MPGMQLRPGDVVVGVDTHKDQHAAVLLDGLGGRFAELYLPATAAGFAQLLAFSQGHVGPQGRLQAFGVEGTGSYGIGLAGSCAGTATPSRRFTGRPATVSAGWPARATRSTPNTPPGRFWRAAAPPSRRPPTAQVESLQLLKTARDTAVKARTTSMITRKATLVTANVELRAELEPLTDHKLSQAAATLPSRPWLAAPDAAMSHVLGSLARRWLQLHEEVKVHSRHLKMLTKTIAPRLVEAVGVGLDIAAEMLVTAGGQHRPDPLRSRLRRDVRRLPDTGRIG